MAKKLNCLEIIGALNFIEIFLHTSTRFYTTSCMVHFLYCIADVILVELFGNNVHFILGVL